MASWLRGVENRSLSTPEPLAELLEQIPSWWHWAEQLKKDASICGRNR